MKLFGLLKTKFVIRVWNHTPSCAEMSRLASQSFEQGLPLPTRFKMCLHHLICIWCKRYLKQLKFLHAAAPRLDEPANLPSARGMSAEAKRRIVQRLQTG